MKSYHAQSKEAKTERRKQILDSPNWIKRVGRNGRPSNNSDVSISLNKRGGEKESVAIIFRNDVDWLICGRNGERISILPIGKENRIYFKLEDKEGFKLSPASKKGKNKRTRIPLFDGALDFVGDYTLHLDKDVNLYFIEKEKQS